MRNQTAYQEMYQAIQRQDKVSLRQSLDIYGANIYTYGMETWYDVHILQAALKCRNEEAVAMMLEYPGIDFHFKTGAEGKTICEMMKYSNLLGVCYPYEFYCAEQKRGYRGDYFYGERPTRLSALEIGKLIEKEEQLKKIDTRLQKMLNAYYEKEQQRLEPENKIKALLNKENRTPAEEQWVKEIIKFAQNETLILKREGIQKTSMPSYEKN